MRNAQELIQSLALQPHPEGGHYKEVYRSQQIIERAQEQRQSVTLIYFLLAQGEHSVWHRVLSDEIWHFYEGDALELLCMSPDCSTVERLVLDNEQRHAVIPAHYWQAARPLGMHSLVACTVSPGFEFTDFLLLREHPIASNVAEQWRDLL